MSWAFPIRAPHEQNNHTRSGSPVKPVIQRAARAVLVQEGGEIASDVVVGGHRYARRPLPNLNSTSIPIGPPVSRRLRRTSSRTARRSVSDSAA